MSLTPEYIDKLEILTYKSINKLTDWMIQDICRRIAEAGTITSSAEYQIWRLKNLGMKKKEINAEIRKRLHVTQKELDELIEAAAEDGYKIDVKRLKATDAVPFKQNEELLQILEAAEHLADSNFENITQTMGFATPSGKVLPIAKAYQSCCDFANMQVASGATDLNTAVKNATRNLLKFGVRQIDYKNGKHMSVEAAVRRSVMGGIGLMQEQISYKNHDTLGASGWEISAHAMSAPDHEPIQGKQYTDIQFNALNASLKRRIGTLNCKHIAFPIIVGVSPPAYTEEQLEKFKTDNAAGVSYKGRQMTLYQATQFQRKLERAIRQQKRNVIAAECAARASHDDTLLKIEKGKLTLYNQEYNEYCKSVKLQPQYARTEIGVNV